MRKMLVVCAVLAASNMPLAGEPQALSAEPAFWTSLSPTRWLDRLNVLNKTYADIPSPKSFDACGPDCDGTCINRRPVKDCVIGKKEIHVSSIRYEYVSIPETRYRWKKKRVTKEIPADYEKPVCKTGAVEHTYGAERWDQEAQDDGVLNCKHIDCKTEKVPEKICSTAPGKTTIKVHYWTCVKEPYTVYRRVKRPVCVKQPCYEKVEVPITRYECCKNCNGEGCDQCAD